MALPTLARAKHGSQPANLTGRRFDRLRVVMFAGLRRGVKMWLCLCDCGGLARVAGNHLGHGHTVSCGCKKAEFLTTHGKSGTRTWVSWKQMIQRCTDRNAPNFLSYGGRGIAVCERWLRFENFFTDMGERPPNTSLDRFPDRDGNYELKNCRWATPKQQQRNRDATILTFDTAQELLGRFEHGEHKKSIARRLGVSLTTVYDVVGGRSWRDLERPWLSR